MSPKKSGCGCLPIIGLTLIAAGGVYVYLRGFPWQTFTPLEAAKIIPQEAVVTSYISTDSQAWSQLSQFGTSEAQSVINNSLKEFKQDLAKSIDYEKDIQPWIGGISIAFLPNSTKGNPEMLVVVGIKDKLKASDFAKKLEKQAGNSLQKSSYKGFTITEITSQNNDRFALVVVGRYLLLGADKHAIEQAIDTVKGSPSYSNKAGVKELLSQSLNLKHPLAQIYLTNYAEAIQEGLLPYEGELPAETIKQLTKVQSVVAGVGVEDEGLHFQAITKLDSSTLSQKPQTASGKILSYLPSNTLALISGNNIQQSWSEIVYQSENDASLQSVVREVRQSFRTASLDADKEVFGWMDREFTLGVVTTDQSWGFWGLGGIVVWQTSDRKTAENTLDKLNRVIENNAPNLIIEQNNIQGKNIISWTNGEQPVLSYAWINNDSLALSLGMPFQPILDTKPATSVSQSDNFIASTKPLPNNNLGYFYLDIAQIFEKTPLSNFGMPPDTEAVANSIKGLAVTATMPDKTTSQIDILLSLKKNQ